MAIDRLLAQMTVADLDAATQWYTTLFGRAPDAEPMDGLAEWYFDQTFGVQVWAEADRAGQSTMVLSDSDLDGRVEELDRLGIDNGGAEEANRFRIVRVNDPDGNRIVFAGA